jgi:phage-related protein
MSSLEAKITITAVDHVSSVVKGISKSLEGISKATSNLGNSWNRLATASGDLVTRVRNISLVAVAAGTSLYGLTAHYSKYSEELNLSSIRTGVAVDSLQKLQYAATITGISTDSLNTSLKFLNRSIAVAGSNSVSEQAAAFRSMGISVRDANGNLRDANSVLLEMSTRFQKSNDAARNTATAMTIFGRSGTELIPFLKEGKSKIMELQDELERIGHVWTPEELQIGQAFDDSLDRVKVSIQGLASVIAINLFPVMKPVIDGMTKWIVGNKQWLAGSIRENVILLGDALKFVWQQLVRIRDVVMPVVNALGGLKTILTFLAGLYIARFIVSVVNTVTALFGFAKAIASVSLVLLASPLTWYIAGITLIGVAIYQLIRHWSELKEFVKRIWPDVQPYFEVFANVITLGMYRVAKSIYENWGAISSYLSKTWQWIADTASVVFDTVYNAITNAFSPIMPYIISIWDGVKNYLAQVMNTILGFFGTDLDAISEKFTSILGSMKEAVNDFIGFIAAPFKALSSLFHNIVGGITSIRDTLTGKVTLPDMNAAGNIVPAIGNPAETMSNVIPMQRRENALTPFSATATTATGSTMQQSPNQHLDISMTIDYEGRPTKVTAKSPTTPINFTASVGKMV